MLNFWATWCALCLKEFPAFEAAAIEAGDRVAWVMILDETPDKIQHFTTSTPYPFIFMRSDRPFGEYGITGRPVTYFYRSGLDLHEKVIGM